MVLGNPLNDGSQPIMLNDHNIAGLDAFRCLDGHNEIIVAQGGPHAGAGHPNDLHVMQPKLSTTSDLPAYNDG